jgi:hypothetical protein
MAIPVYPATYQNPYMQQYQQQSGGLIWVQGEAGAKSYPVSAGQSVLLMDSESNRFFIKSADVSGMPLPLRIFDYTERKDAVKATDSASAATLDVSRFVTHEELESRIQAILTQTERSAENAE